MVFIGWLRMYVKKLQRNDENTDIFRQKFIGSAEQLSIKCFSNRVPFDIFAYIIFRFLTLRLAPSCTHSIHSIFAKELHLWHFANVQRFIQSVQIEWNILQTKIANQPDQKRSHVQSLTIQTQTRIFTHTYTELILQNGSLYGISFN